MHAALVTMPWRKSASPSVQVELLKSILVQAGHTVAVHNASLAFADSIGATTHNALLEAAGDRNRLLGEWLFTRAVFGRASIPPPCPTTANSSKLSAGTTAMPSSEAAKST